MKVVIMLILINVMSLPLALAQDLKPPGTSTLDTLPQKVLRTLASRAGLTTSYPYENEDPSLVTFSRTMAEVNAGVLDIMWTATSKQYEEDFLPLYFPIYRGIIGMRIGIVRHDNTNIFNNVTTLQDLKQIKAGSGSQWADTAILESNGLPVVKTNKYPNLFPMLEGGRFDYFPRAIYEPWREIESNASLNLVVEPNLLLNYKMPMYFFVKKDNHALAKKLTAAFEEIIADGTFSTLFLNDIEVQNALEKSNIKNRRIIELNNPFLTKKTPSARKELWFDPNEI